MADVNRGNRPLSPHLTIYRPQINSIMSILHRITGAGMAVGFLVLVMVLLHASGTDAGEDTVRLGGWWLWALILFGSMIALWYHFGTGLRHLIWDMGKGFDMGFIKTSSMAILGFTAVASILTLIIAFV